MRTRVKICGITRNIDAVAAVESGADALGMVFYKPSPRNIALTEAQSIASTIPAFVTLVGLFVNAQVAEVEAVLDRVPLQLLQFHGDEPADFCEQFDLPYIKALRVGDSSGGLNGSELRKVIDSHTNARAVLLDTYQKGIPGGTGEQFDWNLVPDITKPIVLAGGLRPENLREAILTVKPYAVDVSGGIESAPGVKDAGRIRAFLNEAHHADNALYADN